ncbi:MAG: hypothetical protein RL885_31440 [Planctomycetota bacterium]
MEISLGPLVASFLIGLVGFALFLYGKKQARFPQLLAGVALMLEPWVLTSTVPMTLGAAGLIGALWLSLRFGY